MTPEEIREVSLIFVKLCKNERLNKSLPLETRLGMLTAESQVAAIYEVAAQLAEFKQLFKDLITENEYGASCLRTTEPDK